MQTLIRTILIFIVTGIFFTACDKKDDFEPDFKYDYFPLAVGQYTIYDVDSIFYDDFFQPTKVDTTVYQIKEYVESEFTDLEGRPAYRIERYRRDNPNQSWQVENVWYAVRTDIIAERIEDNLRFIKLAFPPRTGIKWEGNQYIETTDKLRFLDGWEYEYLSVDEPMELNGHFFDSTLTVLQNDWEIPLELIYGKEIYARNVGLIFREWRHLSKQDPSAPWSLAKSGFIFRKQIADYGFQ